MIDAYDTIAASADSTTTIMLSVSTNLLSLRTYVDDMKVYVNDYLIGYADIFVFLVWSFAFVACILFVLFRIFRSELGTKFAVFWGQITFIILMLVCLPFMIFSATFGDFCMDPSRSAVTNVSDGDLRELVQYYATCVGDGKIDVQFQDAIATATDVIQEISSSLDAACKAQYGDPAGVVDVGQAITSATAIVGGLQKIRDEATCDKFQNIWFTIVNNALCKNFYSGIYSLWVSQFITSFFLFWLIVVASISYHYFKESKVYVAPAEDEDTKAALQGTAGDSAYKENHSASAETEMVERWRHEKHENAEEEAVLEDTEEA
jgi:hypothetical protein